MSFSEMLLSCNLLDDTDVPVLILAGALDDFHKTPVCGSRGQQLQQQGRNVEVHIYPGAYRSFDYIHAEGYSRTGSGLHRNQYDSAAARDAMHRVLKFLFQYLQ